MSWDVTTFPFESLLTSAKMNIIMNDLTHIQSAFHNEHRWSDSDPTLAVHSFTTGGKAVHEHVNVKSADFSLYSRYAGVQLGGTGDDGAVTLSSSTYAVFGYLNYTTYTIDANITYTFSGVGPCIIRASSEIIINGTINANLGGAPGGAAGGDGRQGYLAASGGGSQTKTGGASITSGGPPNTNGNDCHVPNYGTQILIMNNRGHYTSTASYGGGGGAGTGDSNRGGGYVYLESPKMTFGNGSAILADGQPGSDGPNDGGGGGGVIHLRYTTLIDNGTNVGTPTGGAAAGTGGSGGDGLRILELVSA